MKIIISATPGDIAELYHKMKAPQVEVKISLGGNQDIDHDLLRRVLSNGYANNLICKKDKCFIG